ncbi:MAG: CBS domain-containing protein [Nitrospirota bacterium]
MMKISDVLQSKSKDIWTVHSRETAYYALEIMAEKNIGALLVIDEEKIVGIFSERDYARKVILKGKSSRESSVKELMTKEVYSISPEKSVEECLALMTAAQCRHMPVIENDKLVGFVSMGDVVNAIISEKTVTIQDLKNYISG